MSKVVKEIGSFYQASPLKLAAEKWTKDKNICFMGSGRDALYAILINECKVREQIKVWIPSYYCHSITEILSRKYSIEIYEARPNYISRITPVLNNSDVIILCEYFGHQAQIQYTGSPVFLLDKTHNPLSDYNYSFKVHYIFGSLRKVLPIADGGFYICIQDEVIAPSWETTPSHLKAYYELHQSMLKKKDYLAGVKINKAIFLSQNSLGESNIGLSLRPSKMLSDINKIEYADFKYYIEQRKKNNAYASAKLSSFGFLNVIDDYLYLTLQFEKSEVREQIRRKLILNEIYPAVLWPAYRDYMFEKDVFLSETTLVIPSDFRYGFHDLDRVVKVIESYGWAENG